MKETLLLRPLSGKFIDHVVSTILDHPEQFKELLSLISDKNETVAWRAAWACIKISEIHPDWFNEQDIKHLIQTSLNTPFPGVLRGCLSTILNLNARSEIQVEFVNACFEWMISPKYPVAVQALAMKTLYNICQQEPAFIPELTACLENADLSGYSPGFISTRKNILKSLNNRAKKK